MVGYGFGKFYGASVGKKGPEELMKPPIVKEVDSEADSDDESLTDGNLAAVKAGLLEPCKMVWFFYLYLGYLTVDMAIFKVLVVRTDLGMTPGKIAAQYVPFFSE